MGKPMDREQMQKMAAQDPIATSEKMFSPQEVSKRTTSSLFGGFLRGALFFGLIGAAVATGVAFFTPLLTSVSGFSAVLGATWPWIAGIAGTAAVAGGAVLGVREATAQQALAAGFRHGERIGDLKMMQAGQQVMQAFAEMQEQTKKQPEKAADKKPMTFENMENHPAKNAKPDQFTKRLMAEPAAAAALGASKA